MMRAKETSGHFDNIKKKVIECASEMFESRGIKDVKMDEIASSLTMSKRTIYELFGDKESLLVECMKYHQEQKIEEVERIVTNASNVLEVLLLVYARSLKDLHRTNLKFFADVRQYPKAVEYIDERNREEFSSAVSFFRQGIVQGIFRSDINFEIFVVILHNQIHSLLHEGVGEKFSFFDVYEFVMFTFLRGISTPKGQDIIEDFILNFKKKNKSSLYS